MNGKQNTQHRLNLPLEKRRHIIALTLAFGGYHVGTGTLANGAALPLVIQKVRRSR